MKLARFIDIHSHNRHEEIGEGLFLGKTIGTENRALAVRGLVSHAPSWGPATRKHTLAGAAVEPLAR